MLRTRSNFVELDQLQSLTVYEKIYIYEYAIEVWVVVTG
jgi:hypothetical protein